MRIALIADIHGNTVALDAVLRDIEIIGGVDEYWFLGDLVAIGGDPVGVLERIAGLPNALFTRGNTDRYTVTDGRPEPTYDDVISNTDLLPVLVEISRSFAWTRGMVTATGYFEWLEELPLEKRIELPDGTRVLGVHASPGEDDGDGFGPHTTEAGLRQLFGSAEADLVFVAHTHAPVEAEIDGMRIVNLGGVSNPLYADRRASYILLTVGESEHHIERRRVDYDYDAAIQQVRDSRHPSGEYIIHLLSGAYGTS